MRTPEEKKKHAEYMRKYYYANKERWLANQKAWQEKNRGRHLANKNRYTKNHKEQISAKLKADYAANPEKYRARQRNLRKEKPEQIAAIEKRKYAKHKDKIDARCRQYYADRKNDAGFKKRRAEITQKWGNANPELMNHYGANRRGRLFQAIPSWANPVAMQCYYEFAQLKSKMTGQQYHVDHIVPLSSPLVCGLHTDYNMQVIESSKNQSKGNRHWPDMPN